MNVSQIQVLRCGLEISLVGCGDKPFSTPQGRTAIEFIGDNNDLLDDRRVLRADWHTQHQQPGA